MKTDYELRGVLATEMLARLQVLGISPSTFERNEGIAHDTFRRV